jgi:photosystem II stability/assembly factor-like uncharacterized protein
MSMQRRFSFMLALVCGCTSVGATSGDGGSRADSGSRADGGLHAVPDGSHLATDAAPPSYDAATDPSIPNHPSPCPVTGAEPGAWVDITPPRVALNDPAEYGPNAFVVNPQDSANLVLGTSKGGIWRTTDCGASWEHINTGRNGALLDGGRNWTMAIDAQNPNVIYTVAGHGSGEATGLWKSVNQGRDWDQILSPEVLGTFEQGSVSMVVVDPTRSSHIFALPHFNCGADTCLAESEDSGATWTLKRGTPPGGEGFGFAVESHDVWYWMKGYGGFYRTTDAGMTWELLGQEDGYSYRDFWKAPDGTRYVPAAFNIIRSSDGANWEALPNSPGVATLTGSATSLFAGAGSCVGPFGEPIPPVSTALLSDPTSWRRLEGPALTWGVQQLAHDSGHGVLYVSACRSGFWRVNVGP